MECNICVHVYKCLLCELVGGWMRDSEREGREERGREGGGRERERERERENERRGE